MYKSDFVRQLQTPSGGSQLRRSVQIDYSLCAILLILLSSFICVDFNSESLCARKRHKERYFVVLEIHQKTHIVLSPTLCGQCQEIFDSDISDIPIDSDRTNVFLQLA